jgi:ParB-like chromosome segregation protein Spo0J
MATTEDKHVTDYPWPVHPAAERLPLLDDEALAALADDIDEHGLNEPVWLYDDPVRGTVLLDGRNRARACALAEVDVTEHVRWYTGAHSG